MKFHWRRSAGALAAVGAAALGVAALTAGIIGTPGQAQQTPGRATSTMEKRLAQVTAILANEGAGRAAHEVALDETMEILYGGLRPLPTKGPALEQTTAADAAVSVAEQQLSQALERYANSGAAQDLRGRALDLKLFIEQMNEVAAALTPFTSKCGEGDRADQPPCDDLHPLLNEENGEEMFPGSHIRSFNRSYSVKLRSPLVAPWVRSWQHDVRPLVVDRGQCAVIFKETRGLMVRLHFQRITVILDPWVGTFGIPRGTLVPIWHLSWVPSEYAKAFTYCNDGKVVRQTVLQRVKQDHALNYFWRFYPREP